MNIAIFSPSKNPYSETFIQAHKNYLKGKVFYYYGVKGRIVLEGKDSMVSRVTRWRYRIIRRFRGYSITKINNRMVLKSIKEQAIDVILVEYGTHAYKIYNILERSRLPVVVHFHGYDASIKSTINQCNHYREVFSLASKVIAVSRKMEHSLLEFGCPRHKLVYNVYGPQPEYEKLVPTFLKKQFIGIGRFTDKKAPYYTIMAFKEVVKIHPDARLLLAGDGVLLNMCQNLVKQYNLENKVEFLGIITPETFRKLLLESIAFVQHSITAANGDMEGTPLSVLEASSAGLPIIATYHSGISDVVIHNETGLLFEEHDVDTMANNMSQIIDNLEFAKRLGSQGKNHISKNFSLQRHINELQEVLKVVITQTGK